MRALAAVAVVSVLALAQEAHTSGSYGKSFFSPSFTYAYVENVRKSFVDGDQARDYMASHDRDAKAAFLRFRDKAERAIGDARKRGTPVGPLDLMLPAVRLPKAADITRIDARAYPLNLVLDVSTDRADERFEVTATKPWTAAQVTALTATLAKIAHARDDSPEEDRAEREKALIDAEGFTAPLAVTHIDALFGVYVGTTVEVPAKDKARVLEPMQKALDKLVLALKPRFAPANAHEQLSLTELRPIKQSVDKHPQGLPGAFHPWGPLVSGDLVRVDVPFGSVHAIVMISPPAKYDWGTTWRVLDAWLKEAYGDPHIAIVEAEAARLVKE